MGDTTLVWQVHPQQRQLLDEVLDWFNSSADGGATRYTTARAANSDAAARLDRFGYIHQRAQPTTKEGTAACPSALPSWREYPRGLT